MKKKTFNQWAKKFKRYYKKKCKKYIDYFAKYYLARDRPKRWAMCHRNFHYGNTDTTMYVESFHNQLKTIHMKRFPNRRIDDLLNMLMDMEATAYRKNILEIKSGGPVKLATGMSRHKRGLKIDDLDVTKVNDNKWTVSSQTDNKIYDIIFLKPVCLDEFCFNSCTEESCKGLCIHMYQCSCGDENPLCKHIHKVHSLRVKMYEHPRFDIEEDCGDIDPIFMVQKW